MNDPAYAGDKSPEQTWEILASDPRAMLVDVRTEAEWAYVGVPRIDDRARPVLFVEWLTYPSMDKNKAFVPVLSAEVPDKDTPLLFLCRSGQRSQAAAAAMTRAGYTHCYNILEGFEGDKDDAGRRGTVGGWRKRGLPWQNK